MTKNDPTMIQLELRSVDESTDEYRILTTWVEKRDDIKVGNILTLKDYENPNYRWKINKVYRNEVLKSHLGVRGFDNNNYEQHNGTAMKDRK